MSLLQLVEPFKWESVLFIHQEETESTLIDSPFPFIIGRASSGEYSNCVVANLDTFKVDNSSVTIQFSPNYCLKLANYVDYKKKYILEKNLDNLTDVINHPMKYFKDFKSISILPEDLKLDFCFFGEFLNTQMFMQYINKEKIQHFSCMTDVLDSKIEILPSQNIRKVHPDDVYKLYIEVYDLYNTRLTEKIESWILKENKINLLPSLYKRWCVVKNYERLSSILKNTRFFDVSKINVYENQHSFSFSPRDLKIPEIKTICDCGRHTEGSIHEIDEGCEFVTVVYGHSNCNLPTPSSLLSAILSLPTRECVLKDTPCVYFSLLVYFWHFNLPLFEGIEVDYTL